MRAFHRARGHDMTEVRKPRYENLVGSVVRFVPPRLSLFTRKEQHRCDTPLYEIDSSKRSVESLLGQVTIRRF